MELIVKTMVFWWKICPNIYVCHNMTLLPAGIGKLVAIFFWVLVARILYQPTVTKSEIAHIFVMDLNIHIFFPPCHHLQLLSISFHLIPSPIAEKTWWLLCWLISPVNIVLLVTALVVLRYRIIPAGRRGYRAKCSVGSCKRSKLFLPVISLELFFLCSVFPAIPSWQRFLLQWLRKIADA